MSEAHIGKVVDGRYRLDRLLGEGAAGAVYAATQLSVDRTVAVKLLHAASSDRFTAEARAIAKLNHTNVITLHDFGFDSELGAHFMVTEYAEGMPLADRMQEVMGTDLILRVSLEIASALHHAHANGVLHRDLKPENVILTRTDGRVDVAKVLDFGLARLMGSDEMPPDAVEFDPEEEVRTSEVGRPVPDTDDFDREDDAETHEIQPPTVEEAAPTALAEDSDLPDEVDMGETIKMEPMTHADVGLPGPVPEETAPMNALAADTLDLDAAASGPDDDPASGAESDEPVSEVPAEISAEMDLRKNLFENIPSDAKVQGMSMIVTAEELELESSAPPPSDLSHDSAFEEEE